MIPGVHTPAPRNVKLLSAREFLATFKAPMRRVAFDSPPPFEYRAYFDAIPPSDFKGHDCSEGTVNYVWKDATGRYRHVLVNSESKDIFMVLVLDLQDELVLGHRLLNLEDEYELELL